MAKAAHIHRVSRKHPTASKLKPGQGMRVHMKMMDPDDDSQTFPMEEVSSEAYEAQPTNLGKKPRGPIEYVKSKRVIT